MSVLRNLEQRLSGLVEGTFGRVFKTEVGPVEISRRLTREMDQNVKVSLSRSYAPNEYVIWLSAEDRLRYEGVEDEVADELAGHLLEHARSERLTLVSRPVIQFGVDEALGLGEFGIETRVVRLDEIPAEEPEPAPKRLLLSCAGQVMALLRSLALLLLASCAAAVELMVERRVLLLRVWRPRCIQ